MKDIKIKLQEKLKHKFSLFMEVSLDGIKVLLMPVTSDIPVLKLVEYDAKRDVLEILFESSNHVNYEKSYDDILYCIRDDDHKLVGLQISQLKKTGNRKLIDITNKVLDNEYKIIRENEKVQTNMKKAISFNYEKRKINFFKDVVRTDMKELVPNL